MPYSRALALVKPSVALMFAAFLSVCVALPGSAQTATKKMLSTLTRADIYNGGILASDGNFYTTTNVNGDTSILFDCNDGSGNSCTFITKIAPDGTATIFHTFVFNNSVEGWGSNPLIEGADGNLYGTNLEGGAGSAGTIFKITKSGVLTVLYTFPSDAFGNQPSGFRPGPLIEGADGNFYGTTYGGGIGGNAAYAVGSVFKISPAGAFTQLHVFPGNTAAPQVADPDGYGPISLVQAADGNFYGTTLVSPFAARGSTGTSGNGTLFSLTPFGAFNTLHNFALDGSEGIQPKGPLVQGADGGLYGTTGAYNIPGAPSFTGGTKFYGNVFKVPSGGGFQIVRAFTGGADGSNPDQHLAVGSDGNLYGSAMYGGSLQGCPQVAGCGVIFQLQPSGKETVLYSFLGGSDNGVPIGPVVQTGDGSFFGTTGGDILGGGQAPGGPYNLALTPGLAAPIQLTLSKNGVVIDTTKTPVPANTPLLLSWNVLNAYSMTARNCHASVQGSPAGAGAWSGIQTGSVTSSGYSGSAMITPTAGGMYTYALTCGGSDSGFIGLNVTAGPLKILTTSDTLRQATVGVHYLQTLVGSGGTPPYSWAILSNNLPDGLTLDPVSGTISGTPTRDGSLQLTIQLTDSASPPVKVTSVVLFDVNPAVSVASVEFTQSVQVFQALDDLKTTLMTKGEPPAPIISGKPAVMRIYFGTVMDATTVTLQMTGAISQTKTLTLQPSCSPMDQRVHNNGCPSMDIFFTPPSGSWVADFVLTNNIGDQLQHETLTIKSRDTASLHMLGSSVCDSSTTTGSGSVRWICGDPTNLIGRTALLASMMPTNSVALDITADRTTYSVFPHLVPLQADYGAWLQRSVNRLGALYTVNNAANLAADLAANTHTLRYGIYRHNLDGSSTDYSVGEADNIPGRAGVSADLTSRLGIDAFASVVAHETAHTLGLRHTEISVPLATAPPGCYSRSRDPNAYWPMYFNTVNIQSLTGPEFAFDVPTSSIVDAAKTFELMSYCYPRWLVPLDFEALTQVLGGGAVAGPFSRLATAQTGRDHEALPAASPLVFGQYWEVSGTVESTGVVFDPVFVDTLSGTSAAGTGTYSMEEQNPQGQALYTRFFTPGISQSDVESGPDMVGSPAFAESIPITAGVTAIVVKDSKGTVLGSVAVGGTAPTVAVTSPAAGFAGSGAQDVTWTASSPTSAPLTSRVLYSTDSGNTWAEMAQFTGTALSLDFGTLPGTVGATALIKVLVSDGGNTGSAISPPFVVSRKAPTLVTISAPIAGSIRPATDPIQLVGFAFDPDDRMLTGSHLAWSSDIQGALGTGSPFAVSLKPGTHKLTLTATDSDNNSISTSVSVTSSGSGPIISLITTPGAPNCTNAVISAGPGAMGAGLTVAQYSVDGGKTYIGIPLASLPFTLMVPGSGAINLVARVYDASGQSNAQSTRLTLAVACPQGTRATPVLTWATPAAIVYGTPLTAAQLNASSNVPGTFAYTPASGSLLPAGQQTLTTTFTPTDSTDYQTAMATLVLTVNQAPLSASIVGNPSKTYDGTTTATLSPSNFALMGFAGSDGATITQSNGTYAAPTVGAQIVTAVLSPTTFTAKTGTVLSNYLLPVVASGSGTIVASPPTATLTPATLSFTAAVGTTSPAQVATLTNTGMAPLNIASITLGGTNGSAFASTSTCGNTLLAGATCVVSITFWPTSIASFAATLTVTDNANGSLQTINLVGTGTAPPSFALSSASGTQTAPLGGSAQYSIAVTAQNGTFPGQVALMLSGLPMGVTGMFSPASVTPGNSSANAILTMQIPLSLASARDKSLGWRAGIPSLAVLGLFLFPRKLRRKRMFSASVFLVLFGATTLLTGCGGTSSSLSPKSYIFTVIGTSGSVQQTTTLQLVVKQ